MEAYCPVPGDDPFTASKAMFTALACEMAGPDAAGMTAFELEEFVDRRGREVLLRLLQDHYDLRTMREEQQAGEQPAPVTAPFAVARDQGCEIWIVPTS